MTYIKAPKKEGCFLCCGSQKSDDEANYIIFRHRTCYALMNAYPYTPGHLMVAPYRHTGEMDDLTEDELTELMQVTLRCKQLLTETLNPQGFNIGLNLGAAAGAGVLDHVHLHV